MVDSLCTNFFSTSGIAIQDIRNKAYSTLVAEDAVRNKLDSVAILDPEFNYFMLYNLYQIREDMINLIALTYDIKLDGLKVHDLIALLNKHLKEHPEATTISDELHEAILALPEDTHEAVVSDGVNSHDASSALEKIFNSNSKGCSNCRFHESHDYLNRFYCRNRECIMNIRNDIPEQRDCSHWEQEVFGESSRGSCDTCKYCDGLADNKCHCTCADERRHYLVDEDIEPMTDCSFWSPKQSDGGHT